MPAHYRCRDEATIAAARERCFDALLDLTTYPRWWTLVTVTAEDAATSRLAPGVRFRFAGARPGGTVVEWTAEVLEVERPARIEIAYTGGQYVGRTAWELAALGPDATAVAYLYRSVRPLSASAVNHFARWGTRLHSVAMQEDALAGLARLLGGPGATMDDATWRADVHRRVAAGIRALEPT
ncbi:MAG TPA: SRPBCC domain-containing protein [Candidatus Binatia bacterium]|nr:SRPBCC domain-containing protein [Candidatus Binatia bacterium]